MTPRAATFTSPPTRRQHAFVARALKLYDVRPPQPGRKRVSREGVERAARSFAGSDPDV